MADFRRVEYPRPDFQRPELKWQSLDGPWKFVYDDADIGQEQCWQFSPLPSTNQKTIHVPFVFQCPASGINETGVHEVLWYERNIEDLRNEHDKAAGKRLLVRFGAVDYEAKVWLNGTYIGSHRGGHTPFDMDLSDAITFAKSPGPYRLTVRVYDSAHDLTQPRGKQYWKPKSEDIFYTPSSGIWQTVWLEVVPRTRISDGSNGTIIRSDDIDRGVSDMRIAISGRRAQQKCSVEVIASIDGFKQIESGRKDLPLEEDFVRFDLDMRLENAPPNSDEWHNGVALWSPEHPALYLMNVKLYDEAGHVIDEVSTHTGMRSLNWTKGDGTFRLNGKPYFQMLFLDQGYWPGTLMTPPDDDSLKQDILLSKAMGFNGCRKHQKVEDARFMYHADTLGFLVWGEMASPYNFSMDMVDRFNQEWMEMVRRDINCTSIVTWTPVNESWGYPDLGGQSRQRDHIRSIYYMTKTLDPSRPINDNCGWEHVITDLSTYHEYGDANRMGERNAGLRSIFHGGRSMWLDPIYGPHGIADAGSKHCNGAPVMCTEFGGINVAAETDGERRTNWGYTTAENAEKLLEDVEQQIMATIKTGHVCALVWTQLTDVEQEQNGLYTFDRKPKVDPAKLKDVVEKAVQYYHLNRK